MRWCSWVIGRASTSSVTAAAVPPSPHRGRLLVLKNQKNAPQKGADQQTWPAPSMDGRYSTATSYKSDTPVSGGAYQDARKVSLVWNDAQNIGSYLNSDAGSTQHVPKHSFLPPSFLLREKRWGRRRRVRNDHGGTSRRKRRLLSSVLISSFPNRKLNLRFGSFPADLRRPLSQLR